MEMHDCDKTFSSFINTMKVTMFDTISRTQRNDKSDQKWINKKRNVITSSYGNFFLKFF